MTTATGALLPLDGLCNPRRLAVESSTSRGGLRTGAGASRIGGIGRRGALKMHCRKTCGFESRIRYGTLSRGLDQVAAQSSSRRAPRRFPAALSTSPVSRARSPQHSSAPRARGVPARSLRRLWSRNRGESAESRPFPRCADHKQCSTGRRLAGAQAREPQIPTVRSSSPRRPRVSDTLTGMNETLMPARLSPGRVRPGLRLSRASGRRRLRRRVRVRRLLRRSPPRSRPPPRPERSR